MPYCKECGARLKDEQAVFCPYCGATSREKPISTHPDDTLKLPPPMLTATVAPKLAEKREMETDREEVAETTPIRRESECVMTTADYFWSIVLLAVPVVGLVAGIVWTAGGTGSENRRNLGRAYLLLLLAELILAIAAYFTVGYILIRTGSPLGDLYGFFR